MKRLALIIAIVFCLQLGLSSPANSAPEETQVKELNFVFLHGAMGNACAFQLLSDTILEQLPTYTLAYEQSNPGINIQVDTLLRCYPNNVDIETWAQNIADSINEYLPDKKNLVLIGHSVGGKAALYAVARNIGGLADKTLMVVTINSPIKSLQNHYFAGGTTAVDYYGALGLFPELGVAKSVVYYDSSRDGRLVAEAKHWLAFIAGESAPLSEQFDVAGIDALPRNMDDNIIPISAQYADGADVIYYGEHSHNDFTEQEEVASFMAGQILTYIFGGNIECSVLATEGTFEHKAGWLPGTDMWEDIVAEVPVASGSIEHFNESYTQWQGWEDVVGEGTQGKRSTYQVNQVRHFPFIARIKEWRWFNPDNPYDCRLYIKTRVAPRNRIQVDWSIYASQLLPLGTERDHYEVEIVTGTPLTNIKLVSWVSDDPADLRLSIHSEAESPFRWFKAAWRVYSQESRYRKLIDEVPLETLSETTAVSQGGSCCD